MIPDSVVTSMALRSLGNPFFIFQFSLFNLYWSLDKPSFHFSLFTFQFVLFPQRTPFSIFTFQFVMVPWRILFSFFIFHFSRSFGEHSFLFHQPFCNVIYFNPLIVIHVVTGAGNYHLGVCIFYAE